MPGKAASIALAAALAATLSISTAHAGMNNVNFTACAPNPIHVTPNLPDVRVHPQMLDARMKVLHCYSARERNELGVWERRTHCN